MTQGAPSKSRLKIRDTGRYWLRTHPRNGKIFQGVGWLQSVGPYIWTPDGKVRFNANPQNAMETGNQTSSASVVCALPAHAREGI